MLHSLQTYAAVGSLHEIFDAVDSIWRNPLPSSYMEVFFGIASFRTATNPRSFIIHVGDEEYVTTDETVLCTRFHFTMQEVSLYYARGFNLLSQLCWSRERSLMKMELFCERFRSSQLLQRVVGSIGLDRGATPSLAPM